MENRIARNSVAMLLLAFGGCDILDVSNPNDLAEENIRVQGVADAVVNGVLTLVASSVSQSWQPYLVVSDEMRWIGSRDAWALARTGVRG